MFNRFVCYACSTGKNGHAPMKSWDWKDAGSFPDIIAKHYNIELVNRSVVGTNVDFQFQQVLADFESGNILTDDFVFVQWTVPSRIQKSADNTSYFSHQEEPDVAWYYENSYTEQYGYNRVIAYTITLNQILNNVVFSFLTGIDQYREYANSSLVNALNNVNLVNYTITHLLGDLTNSLGKEAIYPCAHAKDAGHEYIARHYIEKLNDYLA